MTVLRTTPESEASGLTAKIYDDDVQSLGYVTTHTKTMPPRIRRLTRRASSPSWPDHGRHARTPLELRQPGRRPQA